MKETTGVGATKWLPLDPLGPRHCPHTPPELLELLVGTQTCPTPGPLASLAYHPHQWCDGLVRHIVAGGCIVLDQLSIFHVQPSANAVDLPGEGGTLGARGGLWEEWHFHIHQHMCSDPGGGI